MLGAEHLQRVGGVAVATVIDLEPTRYEPRHVGDGCLDHGEAVLGPGQPARPLLLPRDVGDHEDDLVQPERMAHVHRSDEMTDVWRIKGATEQSEAHHPVESGSSGTDWHRTLGHERPSYETLTKNPRYRPLRYLTGLLLSIVPHIPPIWTIFPRFRPETPRLRRPTLPDQPVPRTPQWRVLDPAGRCDVPHGTTQVGIHRTHERL